MQQRINAELKTGKRFPRRQAAFSDEQLAIRD